MINTQDLAFEDITGRLDELSDKQLTNLITVIRTVQVERENEAIEASTVS
jgi:hypothetical protein